MITVSVKGDSEVVSESYEAQDFTIEFIRVYRDHQFAKLFKMMCIVCYFPVGVRKVSAHVCNISSRYPAL